jgi:Asp-tRNA(Asn)/Glu-tRNA(Gln) amidotransferase A subunit family amidase
MVPVALGTQTGGSVIRPASYCGLYGFKSSCGRTDVAGVHPLGPSLDTVGWLARSAADLALLGSVLLASFRPPQPIDRPRLAVTRTPYDGLATSEARAAPVDLALRLADAEIVELALPAGFTGLNVLHQRLVAIEAARAMADYRDHHADLLTPALRALLASGRRDADAYPALVAEAEAARAALAGLMAGIDALLVPAATGEAPLGLGSTGDAGFSLFWSLLQVPCATLPFARGPANMPIGVQLVGRFGEDERLLSLATWIASRIAP